jgi:hypothetical protein
MKTLLFVDTNILLDFYRVRSDVRIELINHLEKIADRLICTYQVEMEFKKNRQAAIIEGSGQLKAPTNIPRPPILSDDRSYAALVKDIKLAGTRVKALNERLERILKDPVRNDPVYKVLQRVFKKKDSLSLHRGTPKADSIRRKAFKRFLLGYPPRKKNDTSTGDAVNWEWIVDTAINEKASVLIVSRDADYGIERTGIAHVNDWLREEFRDRVSKRAQISMTALLSEALRKLDAPVSTKTEKAEIQFVQGNQAIKRIIDFVDYAGNLSEARLSHEVDAKIVDEADQIVYEDVFCSAMATTNTSGWSIDDYVIESIEKQCDHIAVRLDYHATGDQDEDKSFFGTEITGKAVALIDREGSVSFKDVTAIVTID